MSMNDITVVVVVAAGQLVVAGARGGDAAGTAGDHVLDDGPADGGRLLDGLHRHAVHNPQPAGFPVPQPQGNV